MEEKSFNSLEDIRYSIKRMLRDPMAKALLKNSNLTSIQFETLLIDVIGRINPEKILNYEERRKLRGKPVSRGAFLRTLKQARERIKEAIYTMLLLTYLGILDGSFFEDYQQLFERLREFLKEVRESEKTKIILGRVESEISTRIDALIESL